eukprot:SAG31_NODE_4755_length_2976_cov_1.630170_2_plen_331_part_00
MHVCPPAKAPQTQQHGESKQAPVRVETWAEWDAALAADPAHPPVLSVVRAKQPLAEPRDAEVGCVMKVDGHRVRVVWASSGKKQWTTKRELLVLRNEDPGGAAPPSFALVTEVVVENPGFGYTAPVRDALVFLSTEPPNLDASRTFNCAGHADGFGSCDDDDEDETVEGSSAVAAAAGGHEGGAGGLRSVPAQRILKRLRAQGGEGQLPPTVHPVFGTPSAAFAFRDGRLEPRQMRAVAPTACRFVHFKLLRAQHNDRDHATNIDVRSLHAFGRPLPELGSLLSESSDDATETALMANTDPSYKRMHELAGTDALAVDPRWRYRLQRTET